MSGEDSSPEVEVTHHIDISQVEEVEPVTLSEEEHLQRDFDDAHLDLDDDDFDDEDFDFLDEDSVTEHTHEDEHYNKECEKGYKEKEELLKDNIQIFDPKDLDI